MTETARLSRAVLPTRYDLSSRPTPTRPASRARSRSRSRSWSRPPTIVLHAKDLDVELVGSPRAAAESPAALAARSPTASAIIVQAEQPLAAGPAAAACCGSARR